MFLSLFLISGAVLAYEILLMRIFAITQWYHFASMIISIALLGFGASGTFIALFRSVLTRHFLAAYRLCAGLFSLAIVCCYLLSQRNPFNPFEITWDPRQTLYLLEYYAVLFVPFFLAATCVGLMFLHYADRIGLVYCDNLIGSGLGALGGVASLYIAHPVMALYLVIGLGIGSVLATLRSPAAWRRSRHTRRDIINAALYGLLLVGIGLALRYDPFRFRAHLSISQYKGLPQAQHLAQAETLSESVSPLGVVHTVFSPLIRHAPGLSLNYKGEVPSQIGIFVDAGNAGGITQIDQFQEEPATPVDSNLEYLDFLTLSLAYHVRSPSRVLVLGAGGGTDVLNALAHQAEAVDAVELNPQIIALVRDRFRDFTSGLYTLPNVRLIQHEARGYAASASANYDAIHISLLDAFSTASAGVHGLSESYVYTVEALQQYYARLTPAGILSITRWVKFPPRDNIKLFATAVEALEASGVDNVEHHLISIRSWATGTVLISPVPFTPEEIASVREFCETRWFDTNYFPGITAQEANRYNQLPSAEHFQAAQALLFGERDEFYKAFPYFVKPARDDRPYFFNFFTWKHLPTLLRTMGRDWIPFIEWGYLVLMATLAQALVISVILILVPLFALPRARQSSRLRFATLLYFTCLGLGYLFLEIVFIQKFTLFLAHPVYAVSGSIAVFLVFSGLGSFYFERSKGRSPERLLRLAVGGIIGFSLIYLLILPDVFRACSGLALFWKILITLTCIAPLAFCMGLPFPIGLDWLHRRVPNLIPWAYGINGCASVLSSLIATSIAISYGFRAVILCAGLLYALAAIIRGNVKYR